MEDKYAVLKRYFGYQSFREGQETLIDAILSGRDALGVMPTGAGKSICFQLPALLLPGITLVVSPLISLMKDQVTALLQSGVRAAYLNSSLSQGQYLRALNNAMDGLYKVIYVAPERLVTEGFRAFAAQAEISMVTVDEAHCVSQWGQDFRPGYLEIARFISALPRRPVVSAFTATATPEVREDIVKLLELSDPEMVFTGFDRKNLYFEVRRVPERQKLEEVYQIIDERPTKSGIIYCSTRKNVDMVCEQLCLRGILAARYHAGLTDQERRQSQEDFLYDRCLVMVATNAFGMGIDKSNVSFVIHFNMPKDVESYYQEAGRAGRDGEPADCVLLYSPKDVRTNEFLIKQGGGRQGEEALDGETRRLLAERDARRLREMTFYCTTSDCLRGYLLGYFGEKAPASCENCYNCRHYFEEADVTVEAQMLLSCIARTGERYGGGMIADILRGSEKERIIKLGLHRQSTYGLMAGVTAARIRDILRFLEMNGYLSASDDEYRVLRLGARAGEILRDKKTLSMRLVKEEKRLAREGARASRREGSAETADAALFDRLRALRSQLAQKQNVPSYVIFTNAALNDMCARLPQTPDAFLKVSGVGQRKLEQYGEQFMGEIAEYLREAKDGSVRGPF